MRQLCSVGPAADGLFGRHCTAVTEMVRACLGRADTTNSTEFPYNLWLYQKYFPIDRIGWGLYPTHPWNQGQNGKYGPPQAQAAFGWNRLRWRRQWQAVCLMWFSRERKVLVPP